MTKRTMLANAFSLQMLDVTKAAMLRMTPVSMEEVACNRVSVRLEEGDVLFVAQVTGGRLSEESTTLPEGFALAFLKVELA